MTNSKKPTSKRKGKRETLSSLQFLERAHSAVRTHLSSATDLPTFIKSAGVLTLSGRKRLVDQALILIDGHFVHLPLKGFMHGVDPVQKLRLVRHRLEQSTPSTMEHEFAFHREMLEIFNSVRDLHTNYLLPAPFNDKVIYLSFDIEKYFDDGEPHYIATHFVSGFFLLDRRIDERPQLDDLYYKNLHDVENPYGRGHLTRRDAILWGATKPLANKASRDSCFYPNVTLQHKNFNQDE